MTEDDLNQEDSVAFKESLKEHFIKLENYILRAFQKWAFETP